MWFKTLVATLVLSTALIAQDVVPKAVITDANGGPPPEEVQAGEAIYLSAAQAVAGEGPDSIIWIIKPQARADRARTFGREICIPLGTKECDLVVTQIVALGDKPSYAEITIHVRGEKDDDVEPGPGPGPVPPPLPSISKMVAESLKIKIGAQVTIPDALRLAALSAVYKDMAGKIERGEVTTIDQLLDDTKKQVMTSAGADYARLWQEITRKIEASLQALALPDLKSHKQPWLDVAKGIDTALGV